MTKYEKSWNLYTYIDFQSWLNIFANLMIITQLMNDNVATANGMRI